MAIFSQSSSNAPSPHFSNPRSSYACTTDSMRKSRGAPSGQKQPGVHDMTTSFPIAQPKQLYDLSSGLVVRVLAGVRLGNGVGCRCLGNNGCTVLLAPGQPG